MSKTETAPKKWLIKSSGKVLGPLSFEQVVEELNERKISMIDEVRSPEDRWMFIRENKAFAKVVESLREQQANTKEDTITSFAGTRSNTQDLTPPPILQPGPQVTNPSPPPPPPPAKTPEVLETPPPVEKLTPPVYVSAKDPKIQKRVAPQRQSAAWIGWLFLVVVIAGVTVFQLMPHHESSRALGYEDLIKLAKANKAVGHNEKALEFFRKAEAIRPLEISQQLQMVPLLMTVENQNIQARQILEALGNANLDVRSKIETESLLALSYLREGRFDEAERRYQEFSQKYPDNGPAKINLVEISLLQGQFDKATEKINDLVKAGMKEPILFLYRILAIYRTTEDTSKLENAKTDLKRLLGQYQDSHNEMLLLLAALQKKLNQDLDVGDSLRSLLDSDPDGTKKHLHDPLVDREVLGWGYLGNICEILIKGSETALHKGLGIFCTYEQGDLKASLDQMDKVRAQFGNDASLLALHAFLLSKSGRTSEAKALLQIPKAKETNLAESVRANLCEAQKDLSCAEESWRKILQRDSKSIAALAGLSRVALSRGQQELAQDFLKQGLVLSSQYQPFLELRDRINER